MTMLEYNIDSQLRYWVWLSLILRWWPFIGG